MTKMYRHGREEPQPIRLWLVRGCAAGQGLGARAAERQRARHESRGSGRAWLLGSAKVSNPDACPSLSQKFAENVEFHRCFVQNSVVRNWASVILVPSAGVVQKLIVGVEKAFASWYSRPESSPT